MKKKVLAFNYGGVKDQLDKLDDIYKVEPHKYNEIDIKLQNIVKLDDEEFSNISLNSKDYISKTFSRYQMVQSYVNLYEQQSI